MTVADTLASFARIAVETIRPLADSLATPAAFEQLLRDLGRTGTVAANALSGFPVAADLDGLLTRADELIAALDDGGGAEVALDLVGAASDLLALVDGLRAVDGGSLDPSLDDPSLWSFLADTLPGHLLVSAIEADAPLLYALARLTGVIRDVVQDDGSTREQLDVEQLSGVIGDPVASVRQRFAWGDPSGFDHRLLVDELSTVLGVLGLAVETAPPRARFAGDLLGTSADDTNRELVIPVVRSLVGGAFVDAGIALIGVPTTPGGAITDLYLTDTALGAAAATIGLGAGWVATARVDASATGAIGVRLTPTGVAIEHESTQSSAGWTFTGRPDQPWSLLGGLVELVGADIDVTVADVGGAADLALTGSLTGLAISLPVGDGDSFVQSLLGAEATRVEFDTSVGWSASRGLVVGGTPGLELVLPVNLSIGPISLTRIHLSIFADGPSVVLAADVDASADLSVLACTVEGLGIGMTLSPAPGSGVLGPLDVAVTFVPPTGVGIGVDVGVVSGGGYLYFDPDKCQYAGVGELALLGVGTTIVGVLATKLPDGSDGWSMFLSLSITFTGLQLGFGFTLNGLGGLVGLNRGLDEDELADGVRTGALDSILFPEDAIANAPQILSDIGSVFPAALGQFVFGPIAKIGWGTPTLISLELGIILQLPEPLTVTLLGSLESLLPTADAAVIELRLDVAGTLNITEGTLKIDSSLRDSRVLTLDLSGDIAVRASFFDNPTFLVSFGGSHPDFPAPADFPTLARLSIALDTGDDLRIQLGGYFALSSSTVQFGASFYFWTQAIGFTAEGGTSFDALIYFSPFGFVVGLRLWASVSAGSFDLLGVDLRADLTGPSPWHVAGSATFKILGVKKSLDLQATIGQHKDDEPKEIVFVDELLIAELGREDAWSALAPTGDGDGVVLTECDPDAREVHPAGRIEVRQRVVPLSTRIDHFGEAKLGGLDQFELAAPRIGTSAFAKAGIEEVEDWFAAAQYFDLGEDEKLAAPSFELMPAGLRLGDERARAGEEAELTCDHEIAYRDPNVRAVDREQSDMLYTATRLTCDRALSIGGALASRAAARLPRSTKSTGMFGVNAPTYVALKTDTGEVATALTPKQGTSYYTARDAVRGTDIPNRAVVPAYELELLA